MVDGVNPVCATFLLVDDRLLERTDGDTTTIRNFVPLPDEQARWGLPKGELRALTVKGRRYFGVNGHRLGQIPHLPMPLARFNLVAQGRKRRISEVGNPETCNEERRA